MRVRAAALLVLLLGSMALPCVPGDRLAAQEYGWVGRDAVEALDFPPLHFERPRVERREVSSGIPVLFLESHSLPLVTINAWFRGGYAHFGREYYGVATAVPGLLRSGGTLALPPDSVDLLMESYAIETTFGGGAESSFSRLNTLKRHLDVAVPLWGDLLARPRFDSLEVEVWRGREVESVLRREDNPTRLAFTAFNHLMYGDHSVGWEMNVDDLLPEELSQERLREVHRGIYCTGNMVLGISGDVSWREAEALLTDLLEGWPSCPGTLPELPVPEIRTGGGVFLIPKDLAQSTVVMAHPGGIRQDASPDYFASRVGNSILGASGFTSRIMKRVRTEEGYAYSASSLWTTPIRYQGLVGALTQTRAEKTVAATRLILDIMQEIRESPPSPEEVATTVSDVVNGFVFNFQYPSQILARQIYYLAHGMEEDWLENYLEGIQSVREEDVHRVFRRYLHPEEMTILILGNPDLFEDSLETLGEVTVIELGENREPSPTPSAPPNGSPRPLR